MKIRRIVAIATFVAVALIPVLNAAPASAASTGDFAGAINGLRASKGLGGLAVNGQISAVAQAWANHMAAAGGISHNPNFSGQIAGNWTTVGENVGVGGDVSSLMTAFINSPAHYRNLVNGSYNAVGIGVAVGGDGRIYTVHDFAAFPGGGSSAAPRSAAPRAAGAAGRSSAPAPAPARRSAAPVAAPVAAGTPSAGSAPVTTPAAGNGEAPVAGAAADPNATAAPAAAVAPTNLVVHGLDEVGALATQG